MNKVRSIISSGVLAKIVLFFIFVNIIQVVAGYIIIRNNFFSQNRTVLNELVNRIHSDLKYKNGRWDTSLYVSDPHTPHPNGSSGFSKTIYIMSSEGFIIERHLPIKGFLDSADFKYLLTFSSPQTLTTVTNESWRVLSKPIKSGNETLGVIFVSQYNADLNSSEQIDKELSNNIEKIRSSIEIKNQHIDVSKVDVRNVHYTVSFEIVDKFNQVVMNNGRTPSYIETSYIANIVSSPRERIIKDAKTGEPFFVISDVILDKNKEPVGAIVVGQSIKSDFDSLKNYYIYTSIVGMVFIIPISIFALLTWRKEIKKIIIGKPVISTRQLPSIISFNKKDSLLQVDDRVIQIPYASNQYYLCESLFEKPEKRWEQDELLERFGEDPESTNWRKVYDAMLAINKKANIKLILYQDKTYRINSSLKVSIVSS